MRGPSFLTVRVDIMISTRLAHAISQDMLANLFPLCHLTSHFPPKFIRTIGRMYEALSTHPGN